MAKVSLTNVQVDFPVLTNQSRLLTSTILNASSGGRLDADASGKLVVHGLRGVSLNLNDGDRLGVIGGNGAGKSTLLRTLVGVYAPTRGSARIEGSVGSLIDIPLGINPEATGRQNVMIRGALLGISKKSMLGILPEIIDFSGLGGFIDMPVRTYSTGMHMRLAFAVSTIIRPEILIMDEWLSVGDEQFVERAEARMARMIDSAKILVVASHSRHLLERLTNTVVWLEGGQVKCTGPTSEVLPRYFGNASEVTSS